ncbi:MAG: IS30 family transposase [Desulfobacterales bacterium]|nr:IS30 family transposase [Desulfobacterales bacterium]
MRKTLTLDNGKGFSLFKQFEEKTDLTIYFTDPYATWQRGLNENTNSLVRQYFPKEMNFRKVTDKNLAVAVKKLNNKPRKCLDYQIPYKVYRQALRVVHLQPEFTYPHFLIRIE